MAGGGAGFSTASENQGGVAPSVGGSASTPYAASPQTSSATTAQQTSTDVYNQLTQPWTAYDTTANLYRTALGREGDTAGMQYWTDQAQNQGWSSGDLARAFRTAAAPEALSSASGSAAYLAANPDVAQAIASGNWKGTALEHYQRHGASEGRKTGTSLDRVNPSEYSTQALNAPSYYSTNPFSVDYANIFNPSAKSVVSANPTMTSGQQAQYLQNWQQNYNNRINSGVEAAKAAQIAEARRAQDAYTAARAREDAAAQASNQEAINRAVQEALAQQQAASSSGNSSEGWYAGASGGIASLAKGFKK